MRNGRKVDPALLGIRWTLGALTGASVDIAKRTESILLSVTLGDVDDGDTSGSAVVVDGTSSSMESVAKVTAESVTVVMSSGISVVMISSSSPVVWMISLVNSAVEVFSVDVEVPFEVKVFSVEVVVEGSNS